MGCITGLGHPGVSITDGCITGLGHPGVSITDGCITGLGHPGVSITDGCITGLGHPGVSITDGCITGLGHPGVSITDGCITGLGHPGVSITDGRYYRARSSWRLNNRWDVLQGSVICLFLFIIYANDNIYPLTDIEYLDRSMSKNLKPIYNLTPINTMSLNVNKTRI